MAVTALREVQVGVESPWGTSVPATAKLMAVTDASFQLNQSHDVLETLGTLAPAHEIALATSDWSGSVTVAGTYEDLPYFLDSVFGTATPSGTSVPYTYTYTGPTGAVPTSPRIMTVEYGASGAEYELAGGLINGLTIDIEQGQAWRVTTEWMGSTVAASAMAALAERSVNLIRTADTVLKIDNYAGTFGSTSISATLISASLNVTTGRHLKRFVGDIDPGSWGEGKYSSSLSLVCEFNATSKAIVDAMLSASQSKAVRLLATSGTNSATIDYSGTIDGGVTLFDDNEGNITVALNLIGRYDTTNTTWIDFVIENSRSSLT
jgi:hypothetical protein